MRQSKYLFIILLFEIIATHGLNYVGWDYTVGGKVEKIIDLLFLISLITIFPEIRKCRFYGIVLTLTFVPFLSVYNSWTNYGQSPFESCMVTINNFIWLIYFYLGKYKVREYTIFQSFFVMAFAILVIQIIQQFTYPSAWFGLASEEMMFENGGFKGEEAEVRNGLWRFRMHMNGYFTAPIVFALLFWLKRKMNFGKLLLFVLLLISIYLSLTRQVMFSMILTIVLSFFIGDGRFNIRFLLLGSLFILGLYFLYDLLFLELSKDTIEQADDSNIRLLAATYYLLDCLKTPFTLLLGYGDAGSSGSFHNYVEMLNLQYGFFTDDVGFVGKMWQYGLFYVIICYYLLYIIFFRYKHIIPYYIRLFVLFTVFMSPMIYPFQSVETNLIWAMLLYVCDLHIRKSPLRMKSTSLFSH